MEIKRYFYNQVELPPGRERWLDSKPAVYAWYRNTDISEHVTDSDKLYSAIKKLLNSNLSASQSGVLGTLYHISLIEKASSISNNKDALLKRLCGIQKGRDLLVEAFSTLSEFQSPLYIGKAIDLRKRIADHINGVSSLLDRLHDANIPIASCYIKVMYLNPLLSNFSESDVCTSDDELVLLFEDLLSRLGPATFVIRKG